jgi:hypothetical protein
MKIMMIFLNENLGKGQPCPRMIFAIQTLGTGNLTQE